MTAATAPIDLATWPERVAARDAAARLRERWGNAAMMGESTTTMLLVARPRRTVLHRTWANLPGFARWGRGYTHALLPGWEYLSWEVASEMIPDLERLAETGQRPEGSTR